MNVVFIGLGGNLGDRSEMLGRARTQIEDKCGPIVRMSRLYETEAWGSSGQPYLNQVLEVETTLSPNDMLTRLMHIEAGMGRVRTSEKNADRVIDLDILLFNDQVMNRPMLEVPHPRMHLRRFVLVPLSEIAGLYKHPVTGQSINEMLAQCRDGHQVQIYEAQPMA